MGDDFSVIPLGIEWEVVKHSYRRAYDELLKKVEKIFTQGDKPTIEELTLARAWMITENPMLGGVTPVSMIAHGRSERLDKFITECEEINTERLDEG